ncbi:sigma 54-interacting transcriptional regulator [Wenzhouxiangella sp. XN79A]|uniref:sigma 54-interacting transcriptional regulator n=1 Tax=Wenzhouxiangella sp. XN79A TaxID=2724193 RepID=UPI00144AD69C|nr:sigma 54-interacting transcriptional regulator [Wenzhouxiangella sp. XN79A]NKI34106.1 sigma 54-interacting transcriptional regulator [Wenzhouxiangella sp. XN79A]
MTAILDAERPGVQREEQPLIGESGAFLSVLERASKAARLDRPLLIVGERGTGKELIAERVHFLSPRWDQPLVKLNCAAISPALLESELFGHEAGAFTDAARTRIGRFEQADGGTLVLDELATTAPAVQEKILRIIEYGEFERLGSSQTRQIDVRVIGATNEDLPALARAGRFRADLLDRLSFDVITLPPLRERADDIVPLAEHFAIRMSRELGRALFAGFTATAVEQLLHWPWPGNVRELKNVIERAVYRLESADQRIDALQFDPFESPWRPAFVDPNATPTRPPEDLKAWLAEQEQRWIEQALSECGHHQKRTAARLGLSYDQLRAALRKYGISR